MDGKINSFTLANGLTVMIKETPSRKMVAIQLWVGVGSADESDNERGISHLIEHMAFKGTKRRGLGEIANEVRMLGGSINAMTTKDQTAFMVTVPPSAALIGLDILIDAVFHPTLDPEELEREKEVILEEILDSEGRPDIKVWNLLFKTAYRHSNYRFPTIGYKETVQKFVRDDILSFRSKWYMPYNMTFIVVGDVESGQVLGEIDSLTSTVELSGSYQRPRLVEPDQNEMRSVLARDPNLQAPYLYMAFHVPRVSEPDINPLGLAGEILGLQESSRLVQVLLREKKLVHSISASVVPQKDPTLFIIRCVLAAEKLEHAVLAIVEELNRIKQTPPSTEELSRAVIGAESGNVYASEMVDQMALVMGLGWSIAGDPYFFQKYAKMNRAISSQEVSNVTRKYFVPDNATLALLLPEKQVPEFKIKELADMVMSQLADKKTASAVKVQDQCTQIDLSNGMKVLLMPDSSNPLIAYRLTFLGGSRFENKENAGIMNFVSRILTTGTESHSEQEIYHEVEKIGGRLESHSRMDSFGLHFNVFSRYQNDGLEWLSEIYTEPAFAEDKSERERALIINDIKTLPDRPEQFTIQELQKTLFQNHPYGFPQQGTVDTISSVSNGMLKDFYHKYAVPANSVLAVVGNIDVDKASDRIEQLFGRLSFEPFEMPSVEKEPSFRERRYHTVRMPRAKAHIAIGYHGAALKDPGRFPLKVLSEVLGGFGGWLFSRLRDKESLAYMVTSFEKAWFDHGVIVLLMSCDAPKVDHALEGLLGQVERIRQEPITEEELVRSRNTLIGNHQTRLQSCWDRAASMASNTLFGLGHDFDSEYTEKVSQVTAEHVLEAANTFLAPERCAIVKIMPE